MRTVPGGVPGFDPLVRFHTFGDPGIGFSVILRAREFVDQFLIKHEFVKRLHKRFAAEGIAIPIKSLAQRPRPAVSLVKRRLLRLDRAAGGSGRDGRHAARAHAGPRSHHRAAARRSRHRPGRLRAAESLGHAHRRRGRDRHRPLHRSIRQPGRAHRSLRPRSASRSVLMSRVTIVRRAGGRGHADARARPERVVGRQHRHGRTVVRAAHRHGDGDLQRRVERRLHDRVPGRRARSCSRAAGASPGSRSAPRFSPDSCRSHCCSCGAVLNRSDLIGRWCEPGTSEPRTRTQNPAPGTWNRTVPHSRDALRTPAFWIFAVGAALYGLVASGIGLFNESILAERGFGPNVYYQTLVVTAMTGLAGNFIGGWLARFVPLNRLMAISLCDAGSRLARASARQHDRRWRWSGPSMMGLGGGLVMVLFFSVWPRVYGRRHLGRIQGVAQAMTVLASAVGPLLLAAVCRDDRKLRRDVLHSCCGGQCRQRHRSSNP